MRILACTTFIRLVIKKVHRRRWQYAHVPFCLRVLFHKLKCAPLEKYSISNMHMRYKYIRKLFVNIFRLLRRCSYVFAKHWATCWAIRLQPSKNSNTVDQLNVNDRAHTKNDCSHIKYYVYKASYSRHFNDTTRSSPEDALCIVEFPQTPSHSRSKFQLVSKT